MLKLRQLPVPPKRTIVLYLVLLAIVLISMVSLRVCRHDDAAVAAGQPAADDTLRVAITYSPMNYYINADTMGGLGFDMLRIMARDMGRPIKFIPVVSLEKSMKSLADGRCDILASLPVSAKLKDRFAFSESVWLDRQVLVQKKGTKAIKTVLDLAGDTVHIEAGSTAAERISNLGEEIGAPIHIASHNNLSDEYIFLKVHSGAFRYAVINEKTARRMAARYPDVDVQTPVGFSQFQTWVTRRTDTALHDSIDSWLLRFKQTDRYREMQERYTAD